MAGKAWAVTSPLGLMSFLEVSIALMLLHQDSTKPCGVGSGMTPPGMAGKAWAVPSLQSLLPFPEVPIALMFLREGLTTLCGTSDEDSGYPLVPHSVVRDRKSTR